MEKEKVSFWKSFTISLSILFIDAIFLAIITYSFIRNTPDWSTTLGLWHIILIILILEYSLYSLVFAYLTTKLGKFSQKYVLYFMFAILILRICASVVYYTFPNDWLSINEGLRTLYWYEWLIYYSGYWFLPVTLMVQLVLSLQKKLRK